MSFVFYPEMVIFILMLILLIIGIVYIVRKSKQVLRRLSNLEKAVYEKITSHPIRRTSILYKKHPEKTRLLHANENEDTELHKKINQQAKQPILLYEGVIGCLGI